LVTILGNPRRCASLRAHHREIVCVGASVSECLRRIVRRQIVRRRIARAVPARFPVVAAGTKPVLADYVDSAPGDNRPQRGRWTRLILPVSGRDNNASVRV
jgi:hypothetical protein